jgi:hypothetical protein
MAMNSVQILARARGANGDADVVEELAPHLVDDAALREKLARTLLGDFGPVDRHLIRALAEIETHEAREEGGCSDALYADCFMLFWLGNDEDYDVILTAKESNEDTGARIDAFMLTMRKASCPESIDRLTYPHVYQAVMDAIRDAKWEDDDDFRDGVFAHFGLTSN